ncbi:hypothetical protein N7535_005315 [Penicillium sp. DV-2018c]|nr:hypothetical protein N7461_008896 [Penicillium sp. DV-2018c]KAJ5571655.1 hypothetical protein N7535_005315 [Penicillium sp. DV-2018c]
MPPARIFSEVPRTWEEWIQAVGLSGNSLHPNDRDQWGSGSKISKEEHLLLRVLFDSEERLGVDARSNLGLTGHFKSASRWLRNFAPFATYLQQVESGRGISKYGPPQPNADAWSSGIFEIPAHEQRRILSHLISRRGAPERGLKTLIDEESVNAALMAFLTSIAAKHPSIEGHWSPDRLLLRAEFKPGVSFTVRVDGYFRARDHTTKILVETKRSQRAVHEPTVSMQESAEVIAWLMNDTRIRNGHRFLISQNGNELYITAASFDDTYLHWLRSNRPMRLSKNSFMRMTRYGPWLVGMAHDMEEFAKLALAIMIAVDK